MKIGAQMFTIREQCQTPEEIRVALLKLADIGYRYAQFSGCGDIDAALLGKYAQEAGIQIPATHTKVERILTQTDAVIREHQAFGAECVGVGILPKDARDDLAAFNAFWDKMQPAIEKITASGLRACYHNHSLEFRKLSGKLIFDRLLERFSPQQLGIILDTYWVQHGGGDIYQWIEKLEGRLRYVHLKDMAVSPQRWRDPVYAPIGSGNMNFPKILQAFTDAKAEYAFVEQDDCYGRDPFDCLKESFLYLRAQGYC